MSAADRQRRYRERARRGVRLVRVAADERTFAALAAARLLHPAQADDPKAIEEALNLAVREWETRFFRNA